MLGLIARRLLQLPVILVVIYTLTLALAWAVPGNPLENPEGRRPPAEVIDAMKAQYNLDSFWKFYFSYLSRASGVRHVEDWSSGELSRERERAAAAGVLPPERHVFDLGPSLKYRDRSVNEIIAGSLPVSIVLGGVAILLALGVGLAAGIVGAVKPNSFADFATLSVALVGISQPTFVIGTLLQLVFTVWLGWFAAGGVGACAGHSFAGGDAEPAVCRVHCAADADGDAGLPVGGLHPDGAGEGGERVERAAEACA